MSWASASAVAISRFETLVATPQSLLTEYPNAPKDAFTKPGPDTPWARVYVSESTYEKKEVGAPGANTHRLTALFVAQLFYPFGEGTGPVMAMADIVKAAFRSVSASGVIFGSPAPKRIGPTEDGWYQVNVICPFYYDEQG